MEPGQFARVRALALGPNDGLLYAADACNHRVQVFTRDGELVRVFGESGSEPGQLLYPYDLAFGPDGLLYVAEYGNHRVQKFTKEGEHLGMVGGPGRGPGQLHCPWALAVDRWGRVHVVDTENHRVQRFTF
jgi:DNA-binding beta-propeller fold protein YncE